MSSQLFTVKAFPVFEWRWDCYTLVKSSVSGWIKVVFLCFFLSFTLSSLDLLIFYVWQYEIPWRNTAQRVKCMVPLKKDCGSHDFFLITFIHQENIYPCVTKRDISRLFCSLLGLVKCLYFPFFTNADGEMVSTSPPLPSTPFFKHHQAFSFIFPHFYLVEKLSWWHSEAVTHSI